MKSALLPAFITFLLTHLFWVDMSPAVGQDATPVPLTPSTSTQQILRVETRLDGRGQIAPEKDKRINLRLDARLHYDERIIARKQMLKSIRDYQLARAEIRLGDGSMINELAEDRRIVIAQVKNDQLPVKLAALGGPLTQKEFELIDIPANSLVLDQLILHPTARFNQPWKPETAVLERFLNIDEIEESDVELKLEVVEKRIARIFIGGDVTGSMDDAATRITISGTIQYDTRARMVRSCDLTFNQHRDMSPIAPGLDATFRIVMRIKPVRNSSSLDNAGLARLRKQAGSITSQFTLIPADGTISMQHPRSWRVILEQDNRASLRLVQEGVMLGQCDVIPLPARPDEKPQTLAQFREVVEAKLADNHATVTSTDQSDGKDELQWIKVVATGAADGVHLIWTYYTITHEDGRRVQLVFTTEPDYSDRFNLQIADLVEGLQFRDPAPASNTSNAGFRK